MSQQLSYNRVSAWKNRRAMDRSNITRKEGNSSGRIVTPVSHSRQKNLVYKRGERKTPKERGEKLRGDPARLDEFRQLTSLRRTCA